jgi:hypothetical protein
MVFASSPISVEKSRAGPGVAGGPKKLDRCGVKHEIEALILTGIRRGEEKRLNAAKARWAPTPGILYEYQNKDITEFVIRKLLILKGAILVVLGLQRG